MKKSIIINNKEYIFELNKVAQQANASILMKCGKTVMLASVAREEECVDEDFLPLTVSYVEKSYAAGRIPGGFVKRETKPSDYETLSARIIDRTLRPLFPKGYLHPTHIVVMVLSCEEGIDLQPLALTAASAALYLSDIPLSDPAIGLRIAKVNDELVINPSLELIEKSPIDLFVSGVRDELLMIEMKANETEDSMSEICEDELVNILEFAKSNINNICGLLKDELKEHKKTNDFNFKADSENIDLFEYLKNAYFQDIKNAINRMAKSERASELKQIINKVQEDEQFISNNWTIEELNYEINRLKRNVVREQILNDRVRADGRKLNEVRPISIETNLLPMAHGSCLFTRGQTQALVVSTLGSDNDAQSIEMLSCKGSLNERFMFNYNFPGFCVGEATPLKAPSRRELGHGNLAKRALTSSIPSAYEHTIRTVSEILESNGSSSMASVCGGSMSLAAAGVPIRKLVAGVAMGLVIEDEKYAVLTDIMGLEDHDGDMDFKVAGSADGITAMQMDIKLGGISTKILQEALEQAKEARLHILGLMEDAREKIILNDEILPKVEVFNVHPNDIPEIIGQGGKTIKELIEKFGVSIDLDRDKNIVKVSGISALEAKEYILSTILKPKQKSKKSKEINVNIGDKFTGNVKKITNFGAFITIQDGVDGLLHSSKMKDLSIQENDVLKVIVSEIKEGKVGLELDNE